MTLGRKTGGGSRLGKPNKHPKAFRDQLRAYCTSIGVDPFRFMADCIADTSTVTIGIDTTGKPIKGPRVSVQIKFHCAKELASYLEPKMRTVEVTGNDDKPVVIAYQVKVTLTEAFTLAYGTPANAPNGHVTPLPVRPGPRG